MRKWLTGITALIIATLGMTSLSWAPPISVWRQNPGSIVSPIRNTNCVAIGGTNSAAPILLCPDGTASFIGSVTFPGGGGTSIPYSEKGAANGVATLDASQKLTFSEIPDALLGGVQFQGTYDVPGDSPALPSCVSTTIGYYYIASVAGTLSQSKFQYYDVSDWLVCDSTGWSKIDNVDSVTSVNGYVGDVTGLEEVANKQQSPMISNTTQYPSTANVVTYVTGQISTHNDPTYHFDELGDLANVNTPVTCANGMSLTLSTDNYTWICAYIAGSGDNLGSHVAGQDLDMAGFNVNNAGGYEAEAATPFYRWTSSGGDDFVVQAVSDQLQVLQLINDGAPSVVAQFDSTSITGPNNVLPLTCSNNQFSYWDSNGSAWACTTMEHDATWSEHPALTDVDMNGYNIYAFGDTTFSTILGARPSGYWAGQLDTDSTGLWKLNNGLQPLALGMSDVAGSESTHIELDDTNIHLEYNDGAGYRTRFNIYGGSEIYMAVQAPSPDSDVGSIDISYSDVIIDSNGANFGDGNIELVTRSNVGEGSVDFNTDYVFNSGAEGDPIVGAINFQDDVVIDAGYKYQTWSSSGYTNQPAIYASGDQVGFAHADSVWQPMGSGGGWTGTAESDLDMVTYDITNVNELKSPDQIYFEAASGTANSITIRYYSFSGEPYIEAPDLAGFGFGEISNNFIYWGAGAGGNVDLTWDKDIYIASTEASPYIWLGGTGVTGAQVEIDGYLTGGPQSSPVAGAVNFQDDVVIDVGYTLTADTIDYHATTSTMTEYSYASTTTIWSRAESATLSSFYVQAGVGVRNVYDWLDAPAFQVYIDDVSEGDFNDDGSQIAAFWIDEKNPRQGRIEMFTTDRDTGEDTVLRLEGDNVYLLANGATTNASRLSLHADVAGGNYIETDQTFGLYTPNLIGGGSGDPIASAINFQDDIAIDAGYIHYFYGSSGYTNNPGLRINPTSYEIEYRDEDESGWTTLDSLAAGATAHSLGSSTHPDVNITTPQNGQVLLYESASGDWINSTVSGSGDNLGDHTATEDLDLNGWDVIDIGALYGFGASNIGLGDTLEPLTGTVDIGVAGTPIQDAYVQYGRIDTLDSPGNSIAFADTTINIPLSTYVKAAMNTTLHKEINFDRAHYYDVDGMGMYYKMNPPASNYEWLSYMELGEVSGGGYAAMEAYQGDDQSGHYGYLYILSTDANPTVTLGHQDATASADGYLRLDGPIVELRANGTGSQLNFEADHIANTDTALGDPIVGAVNFKDDVAIDTGYTLYADSIGQQVSTIGALDITATDLTVETIYNPTNSNNYVAFTSTENSIYAQVNSASYTTMDAVVMVGDGIYGGDWPGVHLGLKKPSASWATPIAGLDITPYADSSTALIDFYIRDSDGDVFQFDAEITSANTGWIGMVGTWNGVTPRLEYSSTAGAWLVGDNSGTNAMALEPKTADDRLGSSDARFSYAYADTGDFTNLLEGGSAILHDNRSDYVSTEHLTPATLAGFGLVDNATAIDVKYESPLSANGDTLGFDETAVNHDNLLGFVGTEHIDWTVDQGATNIDSGNYPITDSLLPDAISGNSGAFTTLTTSGTNVGNHISGTGADHTYIDQDVTSGSAPTFTGTNFSGIPDSALPSAITANSIATTTIDVGTSLTMPSNNIYDNLDGDGLDYDATNDELDVDPDIPKVAFRFSMENPTTSDTGMTMGLAAGACTAQTIKCRTQGSSAGIRVYNNGAGSPMTAADITCAVGGVGSSNWTDGGTLQNTSIADGSEVYLNVNTATGVTYLAVQVNCTE